MFKPGDIPIPGYKLVGFIGQGAYGEVWKAQAPGGTQIALKFIPLQSAAGSVELKSANAVKLIRHANLIPINAIWLLDRSGKVLDDEALERLEKDVKSHQTMTIDQLEFKRSLAYLVIAMSLADGSLESRMEHYRDQGMEGIPLEELLEYLRQAAKGLDFLNEPRHLVNGERVGIVHRDVKPANLLLIGDSVVVGDFGVATSLREFDEKATEMVGSLGFMAPESIARQPTPSTDQYALAISYYYLRTGLMPYKDGQTFDSLIQLHKEGRLDFSRVDEHEEAVLRKATSVTLVPRYANCAEFVAALVAATRAAVVAEQPQKSMLIPAILGAVAIGLFGLTAYLIWDWNQPPNGKTIDPVGVTTVQRTVTVTPAGTKFQLTIIFEDGQARPVGSYENGVANNIELEKTDQVQVTAENDSPFYRPLDKTYTQEELDDKGWNIDLERRTVADVRGEAFQMLKTNQLEEATKLLASAAAEESTVLDFPAATVVPHPYDVLSITAGASESSYVLVAKDKKGQIFFRFAEKQTDEVQPGGAWIQSNLNGVLQVLHPIETKQWPLLLKQSLGLIDAKGEFQECWKSSDNDLVFSSSPAVFSAKSNLLAAGDLSGKVHLWKFAMDGSVVDQTLDAHKESVVGLSLNRDGTSLISAGQDGSMMRYDVSQNNNKPEMHPIDADPIEDDIIGVWSAGKNVAIIATSERLFKTDFDTGSAAVPIELPDLDGAIEVVFATVESPWILIGTDSLSKPLLLLDIDTETSVIPPQSIDLGSLAGAAFSHDGQTIAASTHEGNLGLIELEPPTPIFHDFGKSTEGYAKHIAFTPDDQWLIMILDNSTEQIWPFDQCRLLMKARQKAETGAVD